MPSVKRSHIRITSGSTRPHKTPRFGHKPPDGDESPTADPFYWDVSVDTEQFASVDLACWNSDNTVRVESQGMRVTQAIIWPTSLAVIKNKIVCNCTPQKGARLPEHVLRCVSNRFFHPLSRNGNLNVPPRIPYLHFGFIPYLNLQIFVFLPNLRLGSYYDQSSGYVHQELLRKWSDTVLMPSISAVNPQDASWRLEGTHNYPLNLYDDGVVLTQVFEIDKGVDGLSLARIWQRMLEICIRTSGFQNPFLVLYSDGSCSQVFNGSNVEGMMQSFETSWHRDINMTYISAPEVDMKVDFDYGGSHDIRSLPMR